MKIKIYKIKIKWLKFKKKKFKNSNSKTAVDFRNFLLYMGPIILLDILPPAQYRNFMYLSIAVGIYLSNSIGPQLLLFADNCAFKFLTTFEQSYGLIFFNFPFKKQKTTKQQNNKTTKQQNNKTTKQ